MKKTYILVNILAYSILLSCSQGQNLKSMSSGLSINAKDSEHSKLKNNQKEKPNINKNAFRGPLT